MTVTLDELTIADEPGAWRARGFAVEGDACAVGALRLRLVGEGERGEAPTALIGWSLREVGDSDLDGLATTRSDRPPPAAGAAHPNGITGLDHVVAISSGLDRTVAALQGAGLDLRRLREEPTPAGAPRQAFFHLGEAILEVAQEPEEATARAGGDRPAFFWGLAFVAPDLDSTAAFFGEHASGPRPAIQPGRRIATLRRSAGLGLPVALMSPRKP